MVEATCQNTDCDKGSWQLRKDPSEYANGVQCPECGSTNIEIEGREGGRGGGGESRELARREPEQAQPAVQGMDAAGAGAGVADLLYALSNPDAPAAAQKEAVKGSLGMVAGLINRYNDHRRADMQANKEHARNVELQKNEQYPACECGYQFTEDEITANTEAVRCPDCNTVWDVVPTTAEEVQAD